MNKEYHISTIIVKRNKEKIIKSNSNYLIIVNPSYSFQLFIHEKGYYCTSNHLILLKPNQSASILCDEIKSLQLTSFSISDALLNDLSTKDFRFKEKFDFVPYDVAIIHSHTDTSLALKNLLNRLDSLENEKLRFGLEIYSQSLLTSFLVLFLRACITSDQVHQQNQKKELAIDEVYLFVKNHLSEDLSIRRLQEVFFVSGEHICRKFKQKMGISLHQYIVKARIDLSKKYILEGYPINQLYSLCGFNSYNHYFKAFKLNEKMTPVEYRNHFKNDLSLR